MGEKMTDIKYGRKRSGIKRELKKKINDWLESIDDPNLRKAAYDDVIVTGGSIASMLLGEKINDFDLYFRTFDTSWKIAEYYVKKFNESGKHEVQPEVREETRVNIRGDSERRVIIWMQSAGVASEEQGEYHYFESLGEDEVADYAESLMLEAQETEDKPKYRPIFMSENAITLSDKVQLCTRFYGAPDEIHSNYDFLHATCYWDHKNEDLVLPAEALECLLSRTLVYRGSLYPVASIFRMKKFLERGWRITAGQQLKIMWQISEIDLTDDKVMREQLTGVDMAYMWQLIEALKDVPKDKIDSAYIATIIDRIFE